MTQSKTQKAGGSLAIWKTVVDLVLSEPRVLYPFLILAGCEAIAVYLLSCSPHAPLNYILAPPIRRIWGEMYLHYPFIYELLPRLFYYSKVVLGVLIGSVTTGMAVVIVARLREKEPIVFKKIFKDVFKHYISLFLLTLLLFISVHFLMKQPPVLLVKFFRGHQKLLFVGPKLWFAVALPVINFILAVILQGLFVYSIPYIVLKGRKFLGALLGGIVLFFRRIIRTLMLVTFPMLLYVPVTMLRGNVAIIADKMGPEAVIGVLLVGILVGTLIADALITIATTLFFIEATDEK
jgi:hypothetical protein